MNSHVAIFGSGKTSSEPQLLGFLNEALLVSKQNRLLAHNVIMLNVA